MINSVKIRELRRERGLDQQQLADTAGLSRSTISKFERFPDTKPHLADLEKVAKALGVPYIDLLNIDDIGSYRYLHDRLDVLQIENDKLKEDKIELQEKIIELYEKLEKKVI